MNIESKKVSNSNEKRLLKACLINDQVFLDINDQITEDFFYIRENREIYQTYKRVAGEGNKLICENIWPYITHDLRATKAFNELDQIEISSHEIPLVISILRDKKNLRELDDIRSFLSQQLETSESSSIIFDRLNEKLLKFGNESTDEIELIKDILKKEIPDPENVNEIEGDLLGVPTGIEALDKITGGYERKEISMIASQTSLGKTMLAYQGALATAVGGGRVVVFSLEDSKKQIINRFLSSYGEISNYKIQYRRFKERRDRLKFIKTYKNLSNLPIHIDETVSHSPFSIFNSVRKLQLKYGTIDLVIVDYIQCISHEQEELATAARQFQNYVKILNVPMVLISQFNRGLDYRQSNWQIPPKKSDLRGSGALEEYSHKLITITVEPDALEDDNFRTEKEAIIWVIKNKNRPTGHIRTTRHGSIQKFKDKEYFHPSSSGDKDIQEFFNNEN